MPYKPSPNEGLGIPAPLGTPSGTPDIVAQVAPGTIVKMTDEVLGHGEFIYLPGVAACVAGDVVAYDLSPFGVATIRATGIGNSGRPIAIALANCVAGQFGWFQVAGVAIANCVAGTAIGATFISGTTGQVQSTAIAGQQVLGSRTSSAVGTPAAGKCYLTLNRPNMQSQIT
jgi:hypothetical protein